MLCKWKEMEAVTGIIRPVLEKTSLKYHFTASVKSFGTTFAYIKRKMMGGPMLDAFRLHYLQRHWQAELVEY